MERQHAAGRGSRATRGCLIRLTDQSLFVLETAYLVELEIWRLDDVGTTWTNFDEVTSVEAYENVTVPAGTFTNCVRLQHRALGDTERNTRQTLYKKPGLIVVKKIQYDDWTDPPDAAPVGWRLHSWSDY